jgi:hypothetical protein
MFDDILGHIPETEEDEIRKLLEQFLQYYRYEPPDQETIDDIKFGLEEIMNQKVGPDWRKKYYIQVDHHPDHGYGVVLR